MGGKTNLKLIAEISIKNAAAINDIKAIELHLSNGIDVNDKSKSTKDTALHSACLNGHLESVIFLLKNGANVELNDEYKRTPLHLSAHFGHTEIVEVLLNNDVKVNSLSMYGKTPLDLAVIYRHIEVKDLIKKYGGKRSYEIKNAEISINKNKVIISGEVGLTYNIFYSTDLKRWKIWISGEIINSPMMYEYNEIKYDYCFFKINTK